MKAHSFEIHAGVKVVDGKVHYPDYLCIEMDKREAFDLAQQLLNQYRYNQDDKVNVSFGGKLFYDIEEE